MPTAQASLMSFNDYQTQLALVNTYIGVENWSSAFTAVAKAAVILAGLPQEAITAQQTTKFRMLKELRELKDFISLAQAGGGTQIGLLEIIRPR